MLDFLALAETCAPQVHPDTMRRLVQVESSFNPYAIGVVGAHLARQPRSQAEAIAAVRWLEQNKKNYSVGLAQVNMKNFAAYGLTAANAFEPCRNLRAGSLILAECFERARRLRPTERDALLAAFSCYESGNFKTGFRDGYVQKLVHAQPGSAARGGKAARVSQAVMAERAGPAQTPEHGRGRARDVERELRIKGDLAAAQTTELAAASPAPRLAPASGLSF